MDIPINPTSIAGAAVYTTPLVATSVNTCKQPKEGMKCAPMRFTFNVNPVWYVDLTSGSPTPPLSQLAALYVDNIESNHDVSILFPDTGYKVRIPFGSSQLFPVLTGKQMPSFYVILENNNATDPTDVCNVFALNQFIPEFSAAAFAHNIAYGYGPLFELVPTFARTNSFSVNTAIANLEPPKILTLINAQQWYLIAAQVQFRWRATAGNSSATFILEDAGVQIMAKNVPFPVGTAAGDSAEIFNISGLNYLSSGNGNLTIRANATLADLTAGTLNASIFGGILIP